MKTSYVLTLLVLAVAVIYLSGHSSESANHPAVKQVDQEIDELNTLNRQLKQSLKP